MTHPKPMGIKQTGTLTVPLSNGQVAQLLVWLKSPTSSRGEVPIDLSLLPDSPQNPASLRDGDFFYVFKEIRVDENNDSSSGVLLVYDRCKIVSGGKVLPVSDMKKTDVTALVDEITDSVYAEYNVVISKPLIERLVLEHLPQQGGDTVSEFLEALKTMGMVPDIT
jgi:hypothetical protein